MKIEQEQFQALGKELGELFERVNKKIFRLMNGYSPTRLKDVNKGRRIRSALERAIEHYNTRDPRLWDELYVAKQEGLKLKSFILPEGFRPLKLQTKGFDTRIIVKQRPWLPGDMY